MRYRAITLFVGGAFSALGALSCDPGAADAPTFLASRPECPHGWIWPADSAQQHGTLHNALVGNVELVRDIINVPEFHDCQRFITRSGEQFVYREFYAIWASSRLASLVPDLTDATEGRVDTIGAPPPRLGSADTSGGGARVTPAADAIAPPATSTFAIPVAEIYAEGEYRPLGIMPWLNCLYLYRSGGRWEARMVPMGHTNVNCKRIALGASSIADGKDLEVISTSIAEFRAESDYPPVARWDWDSTKAQQYIGIKCGAAWCEVGPSGLRPSAPLPVNASDPRGLKRVRQIKGWYDQQYLADPRQNSTMPTGILGSIIPDTLLGQLNQVSDFARFTHAADVVLTKSSDADNPALGKYAEKLNFLPSTLATPNKLLLCQGAGCTPLVGETAVNCSAAQWLVRIIAPVAGAGSSILKCVTRRAATDYFVAAVGVGPVAPPVILVPGTARWRWKASDEGTWMRCTEGCCDTELE